jgi:hypothetical protein
MEAVATAKAAARHTSLQPPERSAQLVELSQLTRDGKFVDSSLEGAANFRYLAQGAALSELIWRLRPRGLPALPVRQPTRP